MTKEQKDAALAVILIDFAQVDMKEIPKRLRRSEAAAPQVLAEWIDYLKELAEEYRDGTLPQVVGTAPTTTGRGK